MNADSGKAAKNLHVGIIGAGIIGLAVAAKLASQGARVTLIDGNAPVSGTSGTSFAWVNSNGKSPGDYHNLNVSGLKAHLAWQAQVPESLRWFHQTGTFEWTDTVSESAELEQRVKDLQQTGYVAERVTAEQVRTRNPGLRIPDGSVGWFADEGYVDVSRFSAWSLLHLGQLNTRLIFRQSVIDIGSNGGKPRITLESGEQITVDRLVLAAGRWTRPLLHKLGYDFSAPDPLEPSTTVRSVLAYTRPLPVQVQNLLLSPRLNVRPDGSGRLVLQSRELDEFLATETDLNVGGTFAVEYRNRLACLLPFISSDAIQELRIGRRSMTADGLPAIGWLENNLYMLATHSGVTLAPALADHAANEIISDAQSEALSKFRPGRLLTENADGRPGLPRLHSQQ
jgi:glycine/D-amino acid oxidase-like deaminating enzyme